MKVNDMLPIVHAARLVVSDCQVALQRLGAREQFMGNALYERCETTWNELNTVEDALAEMALEEEECDE